MQVLQLRQDSKELPTYEQIESFLAKRVFAYEVGTGIPSNVNERSHRTKGQQLNNKVLLSQSSGAKPIKCPVCSAAHKIYICDNFKKMSLPERKNTVSKLRLCFNCLSYGHQVRDCRFPGCPQCGKRHNSKLHNDTDVSVDQNVSVQLPDVEQTVLYTEVIQKSPVVESSVNVMLATAIVLGNDQHGQPRPYRAVLDSRSQLNFITHACAKELGLKSSNTICDIVGIGARSSKSKLLLKTNVSSRFGEGQRSVQFHSLPVIVNSVPVQMVNDCMHIPNGIRSRLANPQFYISGSIDILLGAEIFFDILGNEKWQLFTSAYLRSTDFGWIVTGKLPFMSCASALPPVLTSTNSSSLLYTTKSLRQSAEEQRSEDHFLSTVSRNKLGRFVVRLPFMKYPHVLGDSRRRALQRFFN
jgi:hypothetical protein